MALLEYFEEADILDLELPLSQTTLEHIFQTAGEHASRYARRFATE